MMIPDCHRRIVAAHGELKQLLDSEVPHPPPDQTVLWALFLPDLIWLNKPLLFSHNLSQDVKKK